MFRFKQLNFVTNRLKSKPSIKTMNVSKFVTVAALVGSSTVFSFAQDTTIAGWTFSQFLGEGFPSVDGDTGDPTGSVVATFRGSFAPDVNAVDGSVVVQNGAEGYKNPAFGTWDFSNFDTAGAFEVRADTFGALNTTNSLTADGLSMHLTDSAGMMLSFNKTSTLWTITVPGTNGYTGAAAADMTFAARGNGGVATVEWLFNGSVLTTTSVASGPAFAVYTVDLPDAFYGVGVIQGQLTSGSVSFDNVQINGVVSAIPEPSSFAALAGLAGLAAVVSRRRRA
jgi:hypothetical protein